MKFKAYKGQALKGSWTLSYKIDGVPATFGGEFVSSKSGKPLHNMDHLNLEGTFEIYKDDWATSVSMVRTHNSKPVPYECCYSLDPVDDRLFIGVLEDPQDEEIDGYLKVAIALGREGLILQQGDTYYKVKPTYSVDVRVLGLLPGKGKNTGRLGAFVTEYGNVGTGIKDAERDEYWDDSLRGQLIEVEFMEWTPKGKFRHPRFKRVRWDKDEENLENDWDRYNG